MSRPALALFVCFLGCSMGTATPAGETPDASMPSDAGGQGDAGSPVRADAGDAGADVDAGGSPDGGSSDGGLGVFVAVGYGGRRVRSVDDGRTWIDDQWLVAQGGDDLYLLRAVAFGGGQFVAVGWRVMTSPDAKTWTDHGTMSQWLGGLSQDQGRWVAAGGYGRRAHSADGVAWTDVPYDGETRAFRTLTYDPVSARWIATGDNALKMSTADGLLWDAGTGGASAGAQSVAAGGGWAVSLDGANASVSSNGGETWAMGGAAAASNVTWSAGSFVAVGSGEVLTSPDGAVWTAHPVQGVRGAVVCHGTTCVIVGDSAAWRSTDTGQTWQPATASPASTQWITAVTWGPSGP
jgi:hypothetical protein